MPTYEYECLKCEHRFEMFQGMKDPLRKRCPQCRGRVRRMIGTGSGVLFKGSGFYATDYRSEGYRKAASAEPSAPAQSGGPKTADKAAGKPVSGEKAAGKGPSAKGGKVSS